MSKLLTGWQLALRPAAIFALLFVVFGGIPCGYSIRMIGILATAGAVVGVLLAVCLEPKAFRYPILWQVCFTVIGCVIIAAWAGAGPDGYALAVAVGIILGYLAPYWIKHVQIP